VFRRFLTQKCAYFVEHAIGAPVLTKELSIPGSAMLRVKKFFLCIHWKNHSRYTIRNIGGVMTGTQCNMVGITILIGHFLNSLKSFLIWSREEMFSLLISTMKTVNIQTTPVETEIVI